ncbi:MAG: NAD(P)/FAD-dependent oxidoreductase [Parachlamydiales bacterium]|jgi:NADH dehydrogenase
MAYTKVIIIGGGFGGLNAAKALRKADIDLLVVDKTNHHVFQPLLYQVASAALSSGNIAAPIREILRHQSNTSVLMATIDKIDLANKEIRALNGDTYKYDYLIIAPGSNHSYFGHNEWEAFAPGLKTIPDAVRIRERILLAFEMAERCDSYTEAANYLRFVIVGGGPTGVEMAGAIAEIAHKSMFKNFRKIKPEQSEIYLIEGTDQILNTYPPRLSDVAKRDLEKMGVQVLTSKKVTNINERGVFLGDELIETHNVIWAAGNETSPLLKTLGTPLDRMGRAIVEHDLSVPGHPEVFVIGDAALTKSADGNPLPGIAPVAIQQGKYVAKIIASNTPSDQRQPFKYFDKGMMATIGKAKAIALVGSFGFSGFFAWLAWGLIHIFYLVSFENRSLVMMQWMFWYFTGKRQQRLIARPINDYHDEQILDEPQIGHEKPGDNHPPNRITSF